MTPGTHASDVAAGPPQASVIVPSHRGERRLPALLDSLACQQQGGPRFEVIVVVDGVDDGSVALLEAEHRLEVSTIVFPHNRGRVAALNAGFEAAQGRVLIRCDDDLVVPPAFVAAHVAAHGQATAPVGVIGLTRDVHDSSGYARAYGRDAARRSYTSAVGRPAPQRWMLWAANCSVTRATWQLVGGYSEEYRGYGWEDIDYGYRLHTAGIPLVLVPQAEAEHHGPARTARDRAVKAYEAGSARSVFSRLHPEAPLPSMKPGTGPWGAVVSALSRGLTSVDRVKRAGRAVDRVLPPVPTTIGRKLVAALVESAGVAGAGGSLPHQAVQRPRVAIAHDYLTQRGGAERVVLSLCRAFPEATVHTLFHEPDQTYPEFRERVVRTSALNRIGPFRRDPRLALPLLALAASRMWIDADVVIASSSGWAHAFPTGGTKIVYCHSPARWLYLPDDYLGDAGRLDPKRLALTVLAPLLKRWDRRAARTAARYLGNSSVVVDRIRRVYGIEAEPLFPPFSPQIAEGPQEPVGPETATWAEGPGYLLVVSRLQPYKNVDVVIEAMRALPHKRLLVIGRGPERDRLAAAAPDTVRLVDGLSDAQMRWAYAHAEALICASKEDFGLTPLEAGAHGVPAVALRAGGYLDTIVEGVNGVFFDEITPRDIVEGIAGLDDGSPWDRDRIREHVRAFAEQRFIDALRAEVDGVPRTESRRAPDDDE